MVCEKLGVSNRLKQWLLARGCPVLDLQHFALRMRASS